MLSSTGFESNLKHSNFNKSKEAASANVNRYQVCELWALKGTCAK